MDRKALARKERDQLIESIKAKINQINTIDLLSMLGTEFFMYPEDYPKMQHEITQACTEFVQGIASTQLQMNGRPPTSEDIEFIRSTFLKVITSYLTENLPEKNAVISKGMSNVEKAGSAFFTLTYFAVIRGEGYPEQLWTAAIDTYSSHNDFIKKKFGFTIEQAVSIFKWLYEKIENKFNAHGREFVSIMTHSMKIWQEWRMGKLDDTSFLSTVEKIDKKTLSKQITQHNSEVRHIFIFKIEDIENHFGESLVSAFLKRFASSIDKINKSYKKPTDFNELYRTPIIMINEKELFIPIPPLLCQVPEVTLHYDLIQDPFYTDNYVAIRGKSLEQKACTLFGSVFGANFHTNLHYVDSENNEGEVDVLFQFDDKLILVECKSKSLTLPAKQGNLEKISQDFTEAIQRAFDQNKKAIKYINSCEKSRFSKNDYNIVIEKKKITGIYSIILTANTFTGLSSDLSVFLKKDESDPYPWAVCLRDIEVITEYLNDPYLFLHFLNRRTPLNGRVIASDEMEYVGSYLTQGLFYQDELKKAAIINLTGFTEQFDAGYIKKIGKLKNAQIGSTWSNPAFENLLGTIKNLNSYGHTDLILLLLNLNSETRDNVIKYIKETIEKTKIDGKMHDFTLIFENFGISFLADMTRKDLANRVHAQGQLKKYKHKKKVWVSLGRDVTDTNYLVNEYLFLDYDWIFDPLMEEYSKDLFGTRINLKHA